VAVDGQPGGLGEEVVEHRQDGRGEEEPHHVVAVPPLHVGRVHACEEVVALEGAGHDGQVVHDVEHRHADHGGDDEPERDVHLLLAPDQDRADHVHREHHPDDHDGDVEGPLHLGVLERLRVAHGEGHEREEDADVEEPELQPGQLREEERPAREPHDDVVGEAEDGPDRQAEAQDVGVHGPHPAVARPGGEVQGRQEELHRDEEPHHEPHHRPDDGREDVPLHRLVVVPVFLVHRSLRLERRAARDYKKRSRRGGAIWGGLARATDLDQAPARSLCDILDSWARFFRFSLRE
jgi:hypothetical protein